jgi:hypothetical protein
METIADEIDTVSDARLLETGNKKDSLRSSGVTH